MKFAALLSITVLAAFSAAAAWKIPTPQSKDRAVVSVNGTRITFENWPIYDGPYVKRKDSVLTVNDGAHGLVVDFSGELLVHSAWTSK